MADEKAGGETKPAASKPAEVTPKIVVRPTEMIQNQNPKKGR